MGVCLYVCACSFVLGLCLVSKICWLSGQISLVVTLSLDNWTHSLFLTDGRMD